MGKVLIPFIEMWTKPLKIRGRTTAYGFWVGFLITALTIIEVSQIPVIGWDVSNVCRYVSIVPVFSLMSRRLFDAGYSKWWMLIFFVPVVGGILYFIILSLPSKPNTSLSV